MRGSIRFVTLMIIASLGIILPPVFGAQAAPTGFTVSETFSDFYQRSGGLPIFGFAVGPVIEESGRPVQYFERQRFEYHTELSNSPYEVLLGRLGALDAESRGLMSHPAFAPAAAAQSESDCHFFAETGHQLCHGFLSYWQAHGLEFGDDGVSPRESLALHGFPISEEFVDPASGLTVQYFERARFEYHPENAGTEFAVLLGRLGDPLWTEAREPDVTTLPEKEHSQATPPVPSGPAPPKTDSIIWQADNETGDLSQWTIGQYGEAAFDSGTGETSVTNTVARSGRHALQLTISQVNGSADQGARIFRWNDPDGNPLPKAAYYSAWLYVPEAVDSQDWWNLFQFKSKANGVSDPMWLLTATSGRDGQLQLELWDALERRSYAPAAARPLPIGRWVHLEVYFQSAMDRSGSVIVWQDGVELVRAEDVRTTTAGNVQWSLNNYANQLSPSTVTVYWDDAVIATKRQGPDS